MDITKIKKLKELIDNSGKTVFFGGAGVSTPSGIPDFRSEGGLYQSKYKDISPEDVLHIDFLREYPDEFFSYYRGAMLYPDAVPNAAHMALAELERCGKLAGIITQNIDGLHTAAGSKNVFELHGSVERGYCMGCGKKYSGSYINESNGVPICPLCGEIIRPDVTLYGEELNLECYRGASALFTDADLMIVGGTSLTVYPASFYVAGFTGDHLVIINKTPTNYDEYAELIIRDDIAEVFETLMKL